MIPQETQNKKCGQIRCCFSVLCSSCTKT